MDGRGRWNRKREVNLDVLRKGLEAKKSMYQLAQDQKMNEATFRDIRRNNPKVQKVFDEFGRKVIKAVDSIPVQEWYNKIQDYIEMRERKKLALTIPSLCAYLMISRSSYDTYRRTVMEKEWVVTASGDDRYLSRDDVFQNFHDLVESSMVDAAVTGKSIGAIFILKNWYGYRDEKQLNLSKDEPIEISWDEAKVLPKPVKQIEGSK